MEDFNLDEFLNDIPKVKTGYEEFEEGYLKDFLSGVLRSLETGWTRLKQTKWLQGGTVTIICAPAGVGKTWFIHDLAMRVHRDGIKVANIQLEEDKGYHVARLIKNQYGIDVTNIDGATSSDFNFLAKHKDEISKLSDTIKIPEFGKATLPEIAKMVLKYALLDCKLIIVDSISVAEKSDKPWQDDQIFINTVKDVCLKHKTRVILITHPNGDVKEPTLDSLAGGKAYNRLCQTVLWLDIPKGQVLCKDNLDLVQGNRVITMLKGRNARDMMSNKILFDFNNGRFYEVGWVET